MSSLGEIDPNTERCLDFTTPEMLPCREAIKNALGQIEITDEQAVTILESNWKIENDAAKEAWNRRVAERKAAEEEEARKAQEERDGEKAAEEEAMAAAIAEDKKKNRAGYLPIQVGVPIPDRAPVRAPPNALRDYKEYKFSALWNLTDAGLDAYEKSQVTADDANRLELVRLDNGTVELMPASVSER